MRLSEILKKDQKSLEDAYFIHEDIRKFRFFENFFAQNLKTLDTEAMLSLCQTFQYEHMSIGSFVFQKGDLSNNKFYIILSGQVSVILPKSEEEIRKTAKKMKSNSRLNRMASKMMTVVNNGDQQPNANASNITNSPGTSQNNSSVFAPGSPRKFVDFVSPLSSVQNKRRVKRLQTCGNSVFTGTDKFLSGHTDGITEHLTEGDMPENHHNPSQFMECAEESGKVARRLRQGEAFGELALKNNEPRSATVFCNTDCEFLIITKEQFDKVFSKKEFEKEIFLKSTIPVLASAHSSMRVNVLFYAFKTEAYSRDSYLTTQGKIIDREPKIFVIHHGECIIEKSYAKEVFNPYDRSQPITYKAESLHLAVVGRGTIIGEEILVNEDEYCYNVKAISENVIVHALTKKDLDSSLFKEFSQYLIQMYETKKAQREVIYQNLKREYESKLSQYKDTNLYYMQNSKMKHIINNSAIQGFSKYLQREQRNSESWNELPKSTELAGSTANHSLLTNISHKERNLLKSHQLQTQMPKDNLRLDKSMDLDESRGLNTSFDHTPKAPNWPKTKGYQPDLKDLDQMRFFEISPKKGNPKRNSQISPINNISENIKNSIGYKKKKQSPLDELLKGVAKKAKKSKNFDQSLVDVKGAPKTDVSEDRPAKRIPMLTDTSLPEIVKPYDKTPIGASTGKYAANNQRSSSNFFLTSNFSPKNNKLVKQKEAEVINKDEVIETDSPRDKSDIALKHRLPTFEDESTNFYRISLSNFNISVNKTPDAVMTQALDFDASNGSLQSRLLSNYTPFEQTKQVGMLTNSVNPRLHGTAVRHSSALLNTRDWRNGIFKKLPRNTEVKVPDLEQLKLGCKPKEHMKKASAL